MAAAIGSDGRSGRAEACWASDRGIPDDAGRQGAYGLLESEWVSPNEVGAAIFAACSLRSAAYPFVFCAVDGTSLTLADRGGTKDFGSIGSRKYGVRGLKVVNALVLSPEGVPLGVGAQKWWARPQRRRKHRDQLRPAQKETGIG